MLNRKSILAICVAAGAVTGAFAQKSAVAPPSAAVSSQKTPAADAAKQPVQEGGVPTWIKPETPEHRQERLGTAEDPGPNPDPERIWWRYSHAYKIERFERKWAAYDRDEGWVR